MTLAMMDSQDKFARLNKFKKGFDLSQFQGDSSDDDEDAKP
jgi:hypothetical protein